MTGNEIFEEKINEFIEDHKGELFYELKITSFSDAYGDDINAFLDDYKYRDFQDFLLTELNIKNNNELESITNFKDLKKFLFDPKNKNNYCPNDCYDLFKETVKNDIFSKMLEEYNKIFKKIYNLIDDIVINFNEKNENKVRLDHQSTHSWNAGKFPSQYLTLKKDNNDEFKLRFCDGHDNGRDYNDFEINAFDFSDMEEKELKGAIKDFLEN